MKLLTKIAEMYAKMSTTTCFTLIFHEPKAPKCLIRK